MWLQKRGAVACLEAVVKFTRVKLFCPSCSYSSFSRKKANLAPLQERKMIDAFKILAKGGDGGNGCSSFRRSRHVRRGRPDGGNGGRGGDVVLECSATVWDFSGLQHHIKAKGGGHGAPKNMIGSRGADKVVHVPVGTVIHLLQGEFPTSVEKNIFRSVDPWEIPDKLDSSYPEEIHTAYSLKDEPEGHSSSFTRGNGNCEASAQQSNMSKPDFEEYLVNAEEIEYDVAELTEPGQQIVVARGGNGGLGNLHSARDSMISKDNNMNIEDSADDQPAADNLGQPGSETVVLMELKTIADVGLVGIPNAGKSTLLGALSRAKPRVGHYAFTTLRPNLGNLNYDDISITVADVPGLIRGAHENRGLGHAFLRHVERTNVLAYVVDLAVCIDGRKGTPPWEQLRDLILELELYNRGLSDRPSLVVANKIDEEGAEQVLEELKKRVPDVPIFPVCAVLEEGIQELKDGLRKLVRGEEAEAHRLKLEHILLD